jgi:hypothetical protein
MRDAFCFLFQSAEITLAMFSFRWSAQLFALPNRS